ncbi:hypothetical protein O6H91_07G007200 [Diphasiastrum complanatum]|uniref:Uncharacterized protein n=1 Tax=Diphasiastrum complanatum TaxID=34168 RepID=A0ACC2D2Y7_DIPCM|nr:hypothetical protein O6H91_07G007200 [Diphasiastrum complanatum]
MWQGPTSSSRRRSRQVADEQGEGLLLRSSAAAAEVVSRVGLPKSQMPVPTRSEGDMDDDDSATESEGEGPTYGRSAGYIIEPPILVDQSVSNRKAMLKELASQFHSECVVYCQQLLVLQKQWRQELEDSVPVTIDCKVPSDSQVSIYKDMAFSKEESNGKSRAALEFQDRPRDFHTNRPVPDFGNPPEANKVLLRRRMKWHANEREALRRGLLSFGLGRSEKVRSVMRSLLKRMRHGLGDIADCCWEFVRVCKLYADQKEQTFADECLIKAKSLDIETGCDLSERVGQWERVEKSASSWLRRLHLLQRLGEAVRISANKQTRDAAYRAIDSLKDATVPFPWWGREADLALLSGVYKHGFGNYETLHNDPQFTGAFKPTEVEDNCLGNIKCFPKLEMDMTEKYGQHMNELELEKRSSTVHVKDGIGSESGWETQSVGVSNSGAVGMVIRAETLDDAYWPDSNTLTRRLKRLVNHICSAGEQFLEYDIIKVEQKHTWSKRQKLELVKLLLTWGLPLTPGKAGKIDWQFLKDRTNSASIKNRKDNILEACYFDLIKEIRYLLDESQVLKDDTNNDMAQSEKNQVRKTNRSSTYPLKSEAMNLKGREAKKFDLPRSAYSVLTSKSALKLKERLELFDTFRQAANSFQEGWDQLGLKLYHGYGLPSWWQAGFHDEELVKGVFQHGFGNWDQILEDMSLGFYHVDRASMLGASLRKLFVKRLKLIANCLCRQLRKVKPRRKKLLLESNTIETREPKRFKYARPVEVPRGADGKPILPLVLTDRLSVLDLGTVEPERPGFHTERHIFTIGFSTVREHASMVRPNARTSYTCKILDGGAGPIFSVTPADAPEMVIERDSASGAWVVVCATANKIRGIERKVTISGTEMFGLSHPVVCHLIQELPGAEHCKVFRPELSFSRFGSVNPSSIQVDDYDDFIANENIGGPKKQAKTFGAGRELMKGTYRSQSSPDDEEDTELIRQIEVEQSPFHSGNIRIYSHAQQDLDAVYGKLLSIGSQNSNTKVHLKPSRTMSTRFKAVQDPGRREKHYQGQVPLHLDINVKTELSRE